MVYRVVLLGILASVFTLNLPAQAETCKAIALVGGQGNSVIKTVSVPTIPAGPLGMLGVDITRNNWNTDWAVPNNAKFRRYIATITSNDGGPFNIKMYLKYSDQTASEFFNQDGVTIKPDVPLKLIAQPRPEDQPYQVNVFVNSLESLGKTYTVSVVGCN